MLEAAAVLGARSALHVRALLYCYKLWCLRASTIATCYGAACELASARRNDTAANMANERDLLAVPLRVQLR